MNNEKKKRIKQRLRKRIRRLTNQPKKHQHKKRAVGKQDRPLTDKKEKNHPNDDDRQN